MGVVAGRAPIRSWFGECRGGRFHAGDVCAVAASRRVCDGHPASVRADAVRRAAQRHPGHCPALSAGRCKFANALTGPTTLAATGQQLLVLLGASGAPGARRSWSRELVALASLCAGVRRAVCIRRPGSGRLSLAFPIGGAPARLGSDLLLPEAVDALLTPVGLATAVIGRGSPGAALTVLAGVIGVMALLGRERELRLEHQQRALRDSLTGWRTVRCLRSYRTRQPAGVSAKGWAERF